MSGIEIVNRQSLLMLFETFEGKARVSSVDYSSLQLDVCYTESTSIVSTANLTCGSLSVSKMSMFSLFLLMRSAMKTPTCLYVIQFKHKISWENQYWNTKDFFPRWNENMCSLFFINKINKNKKLDQLTICDYTDYVCRIYLKWKSILYDGPLPVPKIFVQFSYFILALTLCYYNKSCVLLISS